MATIAVPGRGRGVRQILCRDGVAVRRHRLRRVLRNLLVPACAWDVRRRHRATAPAWAAVFRMDIVLRQPGDDGREWQASCAQDLGTSRDFAAPRPWSSPGSESRSKACTRAWRWGRAMPRGRSCSCRSPQFCSLPASSRPRSSTCVVPNGTSASCWSLPHRCSGPRSRGLSSSRSLAEDPACVPASEARRPRS